MKNKKPQKNEDLLLLPPFDMPTPKRRITQNTLSINQYIIRLDEDFVNMKDWTEEFNIIRDAQDGDEIHLEITSYGGNVDVANTFCEYLLMTPAMTTAHIGSACYSAATQVVLACKDAVVSPYSAFMVHDSSYYTGGKQADIVNHVMFSHARSKDEMTFIYSDFLTPEEIDMCLKGADMWFRGADLEARLQNYYRKRHANGFWGNAIKKSIMESVAMAESDNDDDDPRPFKLNKQYKSESGHVFKKGTIGYAISQQEEEIVVLFELADGEMTDVTFTIPASIVTFLD